MWRGQWNTKRQDWIDRDNLKMNITSVFRVSSVHVIVLSLFTSETRYPSMSSFSSGFPGSCQYRTDSSSSGGPRLFLQRPPQLFINKYLLWIHYYVFKSVLLWNCCHEVINMSQYFDVNFLVNPLPRFRILDRSDQTRNQKADKSTKWTSFRPQKPFNSLIF